MLNYIIAVFCVVGAIDYVIGKKFGVGKEFESGIMLLGSMALSMVGMILLAPLLAEWMLPLTSFIAKHTPFDPSILSGMLLANDMGGAPLSHAIASNKLIGDFNGLVVGATLGATISFTIPFALSVIDKDYHSDLLMGILCGIVTVPIGCIVSGIMVGIPFVTLIIDMIPVVVFSALVILGLLKFPALSVRIFSWLGKIIIGLIIFGLVLGIIHRLTGITLLKGLAPLDDGIDVIVNAACVMTGAFPLIHILSKVLNRPLSALGKKIGLDHKSILGFVASLASFATCTPLIPQMNKKGRIANLAFAVSGAFTFAGHLAFTLSVNSDFVVPVIVGKLVSGITAVAVALLIYKKLFGKSEMSSDC